ncbi:MAG: pseudouridine synthase [Alphaproteobacteria bacterium]|nr:pseudouridine synthase [Alphaproteobacteria bacterium]
MVAKSRNIEFIYDPPPSSGHEVIYADEFILIANKPENLLSVPGRGEDMAECLESRVRKVFPEAIIVHRLDMMTSGVMIMARSKDVLRNIGLQFEERKVSKTYIAKLWGHVPEASGVISKPMRCDWPNRPRQMIDFEQGKEAVTRWELLGHEGPYSRVKLLPETGRTHQLRVHMQDLGYPILGDDFYGHEESLKASDRLNLHAQDITFHHPEDGRLVTFRVDCPF